MLFLLLLIELLIVFAGVLITEPLRDSFNALRSELFLFSRTLSEILKMDIPLPVALKQIHRSISEFPSDFHKSISIIADDVESGSTLSDAIKKHDKYFPGYYIKVLKMGEESGTLPDALEQLAQYTALRAEIEKSLASGLYYPFTILIIMALIFLSIVEFIIPGYISLFGKFNSQLPWITGLVMKINSTIDDNIIVLILFSALLFIAYLVFKDKIKPHLDEIRLRIPYFSETEKLHEYAVFARSLQLVIGREESMESALQFAQSTITNSIYYNKIGKAIRAGKHGLSSRLKSTGFFSPAFTWMISLGEKTDSLQESLKEIGEFYTEELVIRVDKLSRILETFITFFVGLLAGILIVALFSPLAVIVDEISRQIIVN